MAIAPAEALRRKSVPTLRFCVSERQVKLCVWVKENIRTLCVGKKFSQIEITFLKNEFKQHNAILIIACYLNFQTQVSLCEELKGKGNLPTTWRLNNTSFCLMWLLSKHCLFIVKFSLQIHVILLLCNALLLRQCWIDDCYSALFCLLLRNVNGSWEQQIERRIVFFKPWVPRFYLFCSLQCSITGFLDHCFKIYWCDFSYSFWEIT